jgi:hypothetical protein
VSGAARPDETRLRQLAPPAETRVRRREPLKIASRRVVTFLSKALRLEKKKKKKAIEGGGSLGKGKNSPQNLQSLAFDWGLYALRVHTLLPKWVNRSLAVGLHLR